MSTTSSYWLARFKLNPDFLTQKGVAVLTFDWDRAISNFIAHLEQARGRRLDYWEKPSYRLLNTVLTALGPSLVHGFEGRPGKFHLMIFRDLDRPTSEEIGWAVREWAIYWAKKRFGEFISSGHQDLLRNFADDMDRIRPEWQMMDALDLWERQDPLWFTAIPSLLAAQMAGQNSTIMEGQVTWRLSQNAEQGLMVVSDPQQSSFPRPTKEDRTHMASGTFAYAFQFRVHTQAGSREPWIHLFLSCRRYVDKPLTRSNFGQRITVMTGINSPRLNGWDAAPTLVPIPAMPGKAPRWTDGLPEILQRLGARVPLDVSSILGSPAEYRGPLSEHALDEYYVLYAEGMKPKHSIKAGFSMQEKSEAFRAATELLSGVLIPDAPLKADPLKLSPRPIAMLDQDELANRKPHRKTAAMSTEEHQELNLRWVQEQKASSFSRAVRKKQVRLMVIWHNQATHDLLMEAIRDFFSLEDRQHWPSGLEVVALHAADELVRPLSLGAVDPKNRFRLKTTSAERRRAQKEWETQLKISHRQRVALWREFFQQHSLKDAYNLALIETEDFEDEHERDREDRSIKNAVREAAISESVSTQMIRPVDASDVEDEKGEPFGRAKNAVADLLMRQTGAMYGRPTEIYCAAGLDPSIAENLVVIGLCRIRHNNPRLDFSMAVRLLPDGRIDARFPDSREWHPYLDATLKVGKYFLRHRSSQRQRPSDPLRMTSEQHAQFAYDLLSEDSKGPRLVVVMADDWRGEKVWPQLTNPAMVEDILNFTHIHQGKLTPKHCDGLRVVRLRESGTLGETPQYIATKYSEESESEEVKLVRTSVGMVDPSAQRFFHYLSIGEMPQTASWQKVDRSKRGEGGGESFSSQSIVELVPFFLQPSDRQDPLPWVRLPHLLRFSFSWGGGGIVAPSVIHLGNDAIEDQVCLLESEGEEESEE